MEIKDLTIAENQTTPKPKPIKLLSKFTLDVANEQYVFYGGLHDITNAYKITRLAKKLNDCDYDLILVNDCHLYLGLWNDGVL